MGAEGDGLIKTGCACRADARSPDSAVQREKKRRPEAPFCGSEEADYFFMPILVKAWKASVEALVICS